MVIVDTRDGYSVSYPTPYKIIPRFSAERHEKVNKDAIFISINHGESRVYQNYNQHFFGDVYPVYFV